MNLYKTAAQIQDRVVTLGQEITVHYQAYPLSPDQPLYIFGLLNGAFVFMADLARQLALPCQLNFIQVSSYGEGRTSNGAPQVDWLGTQPQRLAGQHVLLVDDILDTGQSLKVVLQQLAENPAALPASIEMAVLLEKPEKSGEQGLVPGLQPRFKGFTLYPPEAQRFVVGYGLDDAGRYRELPYLGLL